MTPYLPEIPIDVYRNRAFYVLDSQNRQSPHAPQQAAPDRSKALSQLTPAEISAASRDPEHFADLIQQFVDSTAQ